MRLLSFLGSKPLASIKKFRPLQKRRLSVESLEGKRMLALLGVDPGFPLLSYDSTGTVEYNAGSNEFNLTATPLAFLATDVSDPAPVELPATFEIRILVDNDGNLIGGVGGHDLVVTGTINDGIFDVSGVLLTGEVKAFGYADGGATDAYDFRFQVTGGLLADQFLGKDLGVTTTSEDSTFDGSFVFSFDGGAKGTLGAIDKLTGSLSGHKFKDKTRDGITPDDVPMGGVVIELFRDVDGDGQYDPDIDGPAIASTVTQAGTGFYSFEDLEEGDYIVREVVPNGFVQTAPADGTYAVTVVAGQVIEDLDFANARKRKDCKPKPPKCDPPKPPKCDPPKGKHCDPPRPPKCDPPKPAKCDPPKPANKRCDPPRPPKADPPKPAKCDPPKVVKNVDPPKPSKNDPPKVVKKADPPKPAKVDPPKVAAKAGNDGGRRC